MSDLILKQEEVNGKLEIFAEVQSDLNKLYEVSSSTVSAITLNETPQTTSKKDYFIPSDSSFSYPYNMQCDSLW